MIIGTLQGALIIGVLMFFIENIFLLFLIGFLLIVLITHIEYTIIYPKIFNDIKKVGFFTLK